MTHSWLKNEDIMRQFRDWLTRTSEEIEALEPTRGVDDEPAIVLSKVGLLQLVEAFTAMRHELKLQTKGSRNLEESLEQALVGLEAARRALESVQAHEHQAAERAARPMVEALITLDEGFSRATQAFHATHLQMTHSAPAQLRERLEDEFQMQSWWRRLLARRWHDRVCEEACAALEASAAEEFVSLMEGFTLIQTRMVQTLADCGIKRLDKAGDAVDPTRMTVVEVVTDTEAPPETVVDVVRPGYSWGEQVVRFAEVRAVARCFQNESESNHEHKRI